MLESFHFIAIGGVGQSALAKILLSLGYKVSGSDSNESKYTHLVEELGARVFIGHSKDNIQENSIIVISSAIKEDNPELIRAKELGLKIMHRSDCLKFISEKFPCFIGFSGTHGKTTTSGLMSYVLERLGQKPSCAIGGIIPHLNTNALSYKDSKYFVAELDESDGTIVKYHPKYLVINNLEEDHLDFYKNGLDDIIPTFKKVIENSNRLFLNIDDIGVQKLGTKGITYGIYNKADYSAKNIKFEGLKTSFDFYKKDKKITSINLIIPGVHNVYNTLAVLSVLDDLGLSDYEQYFSEFSGMGRRFQIVADDKITIVDDYAHHPHEIQATLSAIKNVKRRKVVIFQPHRYTRLKGLWSEFLNSFNDIDKLFVLDVFSAGDPYNPQYNSLNFVEKIKKQKVDATYIKGIIKEAAASIAPKLKEGDIVLTLGAGDITKIGGEINGFFSK